MWALLTWLDFMLAVGVGFWTTPSPCSIHSVTHFVQENLPSDLKAYPMKVGEYNQQVLQAYGSRGQGMTLPYSNNTVGFLVIHGDEELHMGDSFERLSTIEPKLKDMGCESTMNVTLISPNDMNSKTSLPVMQMQIAAHASGAAYYYQRSSVNEEPKSWADKNVFGVAISRYFERNTMITGFVLLSNFEDPAFFSIPPMDVYSTDQMKIELLNKFNNL